MTELAQVVAEIERLMVRLRAMVGEEPSVSQDDSPPSDLMRPNEVIYEFGVSRSSLHRFCQLHPLGSDHGFSFFDPARQRYLISRSRFAAFLRRRGTLWDGKQPRRDIGGTSSE